MLTGGKNWPLQDSALMPISLTASLWPQKIADGEQKDRLENRLHELVLSGQLDLATA
jgi:hypothetical protein